MKLKNTYFPNIVENKPSELNGSAILNFYGANRTFGRFTRITKCRKLKHNATVSVARNNSENLEFRFFFKFYPTDELYNKVSIGIYYEKHNRMVIGNHIF